MHRSVARRLPGVERIERSQGRINLSGQPTRTPTLHSTDGGIEPPVATVGVAVITTMTRQRMGRPEAGGHLRCRCRLGHALQQ